MGLLSRLLGNEEVHPFKCDIHHISLDSRVMRKEEIPYGYKGSHYPDFTIYPDGSPACGTEYAFICPECEKEELNEEKRARNEIEQRERLTNTFTCPECGRSYDKRNTSYCTNCGADVWGVHTCKCGHIWSVRERFCPICGEKNKYK